MWRWMTDLHGLKALSDIHYVQKEPHPHLVPLKQIWANDLFLMIFNTDIPSQTYNAIPYIYIDISMFNMVEDVRLGSSTG